MDKCLFLYNKILLSNKKKILIYVSTWMNPENITLCERRQTQKASYYTIPFIRNVQIQRQKCRLVTDRSWERKK